MGRDGRDSCANGVAQICFRLDGIPLAIELAAARSKLFSPEQIAARLDDRFRLLTSGSRTAMPRQQTLRAAIEWSHSLLSEQERILFRRLSVFAGGWTFEAAEQVCMGNGLATSDVLELLAHLVDKSLVTTETRGQETRHRLLETIREYALERLREAGETAQVRTRHLEFFASFAEQAEPHLKRAEQLQWLERLDAEVDNLRAALRWSIDAVDESSVTNLREAGLRLVGALQDYWIMHSLLSEGRGWFEHMLAQTNKTEWAAVRAKALDGAGLLAWAQGDDAAALPLLDESVAIFRKIEQYSGLANALLHRGYVALNQGDMPLRRSLNEESLTLFRALGDHWGIARSLNALGVAARASGNFDRARALFDESLACHRQFGHIWEIPILLRNLGLLAYAQHDYTAARSLLAESLANCRELDNKLLTAWVLRNFGDVEKHEGNYERATALYRESLSLAQELGAVSDAALNLVNLAIVALAVSQLVRAVRLLGAANALHGSNNILLDAEDRTNYEGNLARALDQLDEAEFNSAWQEGQALTLEQAIELALREETANG